MAENQDSENKKGFQWQELVTEAQSCWRQLPHKGFFFGLLGVWLAFFHLLGNSTFGYIDTSSLFAWLYNAYNAPNSEDGHGNLIPFVVAALFWHKRREWMASLKDPWWPGFIGLAISLILHLAGYILQQPRLSAIALFFGIYSIIGLTWGQECLKRSFFPLVLFVFCIPIGSLAEKITFPLRLVVTHISVGFSHTFLGIDIIRDGTRLFDPQGTFQYDVAPACSGIRSLITLLALTTIYGFITFKKLWKRIVMVFLAVPLAIAGNVIRITAVIISAEAFGQDIGTKVHDGAGFVTFAIALACLMILGHWWREEESQGIK